MVSLLPSQLGGIIVDPSGAAVSNAQVTVTHLDTGAIRNVMTDSSGRWIVSNLSSGRVKIAANATGFNQYVIHGNYDASRPAPFNFRLESRRGFANAEVTAGDLSLNGRSIKASPFNQVLTSTGRKRLPKKSRRRLLERDEPTAARFWCIAGTR